MEIAERKKFKLINFIIHNKKATFCMFFILMLLICGVFANKVAPNSPTGIELAHKLERPSLKYPFGTDNLGRCVFSRVLYGTRYSLGISLGIMVTTFFISVVIGCFSGFMGGRVDNIIMRFIDIVLAFPGIILSLVIVGILGTGFKNLMLAMIITSWAGNARIIRGMVLSLKESNYIKAAQISGTNGFKLVIKHILPNVMSQIIVMATMSMGGILLSISGLSFLGLGVQPPTPEWGVMLNEARNFFQVAPYLLFFPGAVIASVSLAFNVLGDCLRDILDPNKTARN